MGTVKLIFIVALLMACINAASINLFGVIRDQAPDRMKLKENDKYGSCGDANNGNGFSGTDFQIDSSSYKENEKNLVGSQCDNSNINTCGRLISTADPTPNYKYSGASPDGNVKSPSSFNKWFHNSDQTKNVNHTIVLTENKDGLYVFESESFFPIDGKGWKDYHYKGDTKHNFGFCMEAHTKFGYRGGETFRFFGDDDVWVYINNYLVIDLGSLHSKMSMEIKLDDIANAIGLRRNNNYRLDFFHCERHTTQSNFQVYTSLDFVCYKYDWCGICEGSGQSCCTADYLAKNCEDNNKCTVATCNPENGACVQNKLPCEPIDKCHTASCDPQKGCIQADLTCTDADPCTEDGCNTNSGCTFTPKICPARNCFNAECVPGVGCNYTAKVCNDGNACTDDTCDASTGQCKFSTKNCNDNNPCTTDTCNTKTGCSNKGCDDGNACTEDNCIVGQGCSFPPKVCGTDKCKDYSCSAGNCQSKDVTCVAQDKCHSVSCNSTTGCVQQKLTCDDGNACTNDFCDPVSRGCYTETRKCDDGNACTANNCDSKSGCNYPLLNLDDGDKCTNDLCDSKTGIYRTNVTCNDGNVCTIDTCDKNTGCRYLTNTCADTDLCTTDSCNKNMPEGSQCIHTPITGCTGCKYANGTALTCTTTDRCNPSVCDVENKVCKNVRVNCDDGNACTDDSCQDGDCVTKPTSCTHTDKCMVPSCDTTSGCKFTRKTCDDSNPCTVDQCVSATGNCTNTLVDTYCTTCGAAACSYSDACKPSICDTATSTCSVQEVTCNDNNPCTTDKCKDNSGKAQCSNSAVVCAASADACKPNLCSIAAGGCASAPVNCSQTDPCKVGSCQVDTKGLPVCVSSNKQCPTKDACHPAVCNADGTCGFTEVKCNDNDPCTDDICVDVAGVATCSAPPKSCGNDECGPMKCNPTNGTCVTAPMSCDDGNDCTLDSFTCANESTNCTYTPSDFCDDHDMCTNDVCNTANFTTPCSHDNVTCMPNRCQISTGCNSTSGCTFDAVDCSALMGDACKIATCDVRDGCILEDRVCPKADDNGCFKPACNSSAVAGQDPCYTVRRDNFGTRFSDNKVICAFRYDGTVKKIAIGAGAAVGIAIGAAAAAGFIGYGGKKGYDYWKTMQNERFNGVQNNPLYDGPTGETENPLYNRMSTQI